MAKKKPEVKTFSREELIEQVSGITIDGVNNYADLCEMVEN